MKFQHLIAPALALLGSAYWLSQKNDTITALTQEANSIRERLGIHDKTTSRAADALSSAKPKKPNKFLLPDGSLNWKLIAEKTAQTSGIRDRLKLQKIFMGVTENEIIDGLEKISSLNLEPNTLAIIKQRLLSQLSEKNPLAALLGLSGTDSIQPSNLFRTGLIISNVAKEDSAAAIAWMDKKITEGKLRSTSLNQGQDARLYLEHSLLSQFISSDYDAAKSRLEGLSDSEKIHLLTDNNYRLTGESALNFLKLARETLPPENVSETISTALRSQNYQTLSDLGAAITNLPLSVNERTNVIENLVSHYLRNNTSDDQFQKIYQWSKTEAPGQEAAIISNSLTKSDDDRQNSQAIFKKALAVSQSLDNPEILSSFISKFSAGGNKETIDRQIERFNDPALAEHYRTLVEALPKDSTKSE